MYIHTYIYIYIYLCNEEEVGLLARVDAQVYGILDHVLRAHTHHARVIHGYTHAVHQHRHTLDTCHTFTGTRHTRSRPARTLARLPPWEASKRQEHHAAKASRTCASTTARPPSSVFVFAGLSSSCPDCLGEHILLAPCRNKDRPSPSLSMLQTDENDLWRVCVYPYIYIHSYTHTYADVYIRTNVHIDTHTHPTYMYTRTDRQRGRQKEMG